jgi:SAM-dependent methyltransferase
MRKAQGLRLKPMASNQEIDSSGDIAKLSHWESVWRSTKTVHAFSSYNYYDFRLANLFQSLAGPGSRVLDIGCGGSRWVSFFDRVLHCESWGIDYSPEGLRLAERHSAGRESEVHLIQGDFFDDSLLPIGYFDLLYSLGFVEHFRDISVVTRRIERLLRPGGRVMTLIPNFVSVYGSLQKTLNREVFEKHVVMDGPALDAHHIAAGLTPEMPATFWGCFAPGVINFGRAGQFVLPPIKALQHLVCWTLYGLSCTFESRKTSPYVVGVYRKNGDEPPH